MKRFLLTMLLVSVGALTACSWSSQQLGPNEYELSGYFDFTMKGSVVAQALETQAEAYCQTVNPGSTPQVYSIEYKNRVFDYQAQRASAVIRFHCNK